MHIDRASFARIALTVAGAACGAAPAPPPADAVLEIPRQPPLPAHLDGGALGPPSDASAEPPADIERDDEGEREGEGDEEGARPQRGRVRLASVATPAPARNGAFAPSGALR